MNDKERQEFDYKRLQLEIRRQDLEARTKKIEQTAVYDAKYIYVKGGHIKNEIIGFLTVFNYDRAFNLDIKRHIEYDDKDKALYLNIYQPKGRDYTVKMPVFVYIHGGGWIGGLPETREGFTTRVAADGYFVVSLFYGHSPFYPHPKPIENIYKALGWIIDHATEYGLDLNNIFVGGESAGGHLASMVGAISSNNDYKARFHLDERSKNIKVSGLVLNCGVYDMEKAVTTGFKNIVFYVESYCGGVPIDKAPEEERREISPINYVTQDFPPCFVITAEHDRLAVLGYDLVAKLEENHVPYAHYHGEGRLAVHAFAVAQVLKITKEAMKGVKKFLRQLQK